MATIDTPDTSGAGEIAFLMLALFAQMERVFTHERAAHARSVAAKTGRRPGRPRKMTDAQVSRAKAALDTGASLGDVAADYDVDRSTLYRRVEQLRLEEQELRCRSCEALIDSSSVSCGNCGQDDPAPAARAALEEVLAEQPPAMQTDDRGGIASGRSGTAPGSLADQEG